MDLVGRAAHHNDVRDLVKVRLRVGVGVRVRVSVAMPGTSAFILSLPPAWSKWWCVVSTCPRRGSTL